MSAEQVVSAVHAGDAGALEALLSEDPSLIQAPENGCVSLALSAVYHGHPELVGILRRHGANLSLFDACAVGDQEAVRSALDGSPAKLGEFSPDGWTPLHLAVFFGHRGVAEHLLAHGADVHGVSRNGMAVTPLQSALAGCHEDCAILLIAHGADVDGKPAAGWPPLLYCAQSGLIRAARLLLERGADPNAPGPEGQTALAMAKENGNEEVADLLSASSASLR
jgi:ankyrin repeat protein